MLASSETFQALYQLPFSKAKSFWALPAARFARYHATVMTTENVLRKTSLREKSQLMSASEIERTLVRVAHEIVEKNDGVNGLGLVGIRRRGVPLANRLGKLIGRIEDTVIPVGSLDITFYRDDLSTVGPKPVVQESEIGFSIQDKNIVLVDDVLFTGRTVRAALDALFSHGRPRRVQLCVLIDRGHRELPVEASFVGRTVQTTMQEVIEVKLVEIDGAEKVLLMEKSA
jgi:pyrimidine operon attenuation protein / uracil phosphoribosyltransferase